MGFLGFSQPCSLRPESSPWNIPGHLFRRHDDLWTGGELREPRGRQLLAWCAPCLYLRSSALSNPGSFLLYPRVLSTMTFRATVILSLVLASVSLAQDPCATLGGKKWAAPADVRACYQSLKVDEAEKSNVSCKGNLSRIHLEPLGHRLLKSSTKPLPSTHRQTIRFKPQLRLIKTYMRISIRILHGLAARAMTQLTISTSICLAALRG